ncbi:MAG: PAS domain S-box protein, partial [Oscillochloris sp.]|nr:PAS domain S-box protein [Oscillochloris sp.]
HYDSASAFKNQLNDNNIADMMFDRDGALWVATWSGGLWRMAPDRPGEFTTIQHNAADPESLSSNNVYSLLQDRSGVLWVGTLNAGINKLNLANLKFRTYRHDASNPDSIASDHVGSFAEASDGGIWVGTWDSGLAHFDPASGVFRPYRHDPNDPQSLSSDIVMSLHTDRDGTLWVGTLGGGLNRRDPRSDRFVRYRHDPADAGSLLEDQVTTLLRDSEGRLWAGTFAGLSRFDPQASGFVNYPLQAPVTALAQIGDTLWVGTWGGGALQLKLDSASLVPGQATFTTLSHDPAKPNSLSENSIWCIYPTADGIVWLATQAGLNRYDPQQGSFTVYGEKDGLRNATILGILEDRQGSLWVTTNNGLARFDPQTKRFRVYDRNDGLQGNEFNSNGYLRTSGGEFYVGGVNGFSVFDPLSLTHNEQPPQVVITSFAIFNQPQIFDSQGRRPISLNYNQNFISFEFAALDYQAPQKNQYAYKLEGFDKDWISAGMRNYASYTNLPGGSYTFRVRAANNDGVWNQEGTALPLIVRPPFWQLWPFQVGVLLLLTTLVVGGFQWRVRAVRQQNARLQAMVDEQRRVEAELRESEARFRSIFDNTAVGMALMSLDRRITQVNQAATHLTGYSSEEMLNLNPTLLAVEDDRLLDLHLFGELVAGQRDQYSVEKRYIRKDGSAFWGRVNFSAVCDAEGKPAYTIGIIEDITDQKESAERLAAQEAEYRRMLEQRIAERTEELSLANERLREKAAQDAVAAERTRLARDLHDAVTQTLFSTTLIADVLPDIWAMNPDEGRRRLEEVRQLTRGALAEMRTLLVELRPNALTEVPLPTLLRQLSEALTGRARISIQCDSEGERKLPGDVQIALYRIAQEALNN